MFSRLVFLYALFCFAFSSCNPSISRIDFTRNPTNRNECEVTIARFADLSGITVEKIGRVELGLGEFSRLTKFEARKILEKEACAVNANFVNIIDEYNSKKYNNLYRCIAEIYEVDMEYLNSLGVDINKRDTLVYDFESKLSWEDFRGKTVNRDSAYDKSYLYTTLMIKTREFSAWWGYALYDIHAVVFRDISWIDPQFINEPFLDYHQTLFDISELYALKLQNELNEEKINLSNTDKIAEMFKTQKEKMAEYQIEFKQKTNYGQNIDKLNYWSDRIRKELTSIKANALQQ